MYLRFLLTSLWCTILRFFRLCKGFNSFTLSVQHETSLFPRSPRLQGIFVSLSHCLKLLWEHIHIQVVILCVCQRNNSNWNLLHNLSLRQRVEHGQRARDRSSMDCGLWIVNCCASIRTARIVNVNRVGRAMLRVHSHDAAVSGLVPSVVGSATYWNLCQFKKQSCRVNHKTQLSPSHTARWSVLGVGQRVGLLWEQKGGCGCRRGVERGGARLTTQLKSHLKAFLRVSVLETALPCPLITPLPSRVSPLGPSCLCITISYTKTFDCRQSDALDDHHQNMPLVFCALIASQSSWLHTHTHIHTWREREIQTVCPTLGT